MNYILECELEEEEAMAKAETLALRVIAERLEHGESRALAFSIAVPPNLKQIKLTQPNA